MKHTVYLALGANVGVKKKNIGKAIVLLNEKISDIKQAKLYTTKPWGYKKQDDFLNTAIFGMTPLSPFELLKFVKDVEKKVGRIKRFRWGPREIDIDILFYDGLVLETEKLTLPHPRLHKRDFVLTSLMDINPNLVHPKLKKKIRELYKEIPGDNRTVIS